MFPAALFTIAKIWNQHKCPSIDEWIKKKQRIYTTENDSAIKRTEILPSATTRMDPEGTVLSEMGQTEKERCYMISLLCRIQKTK